MKQAMIVAAVLVAAMLAPTALAEDYVEGWGLAVGAEVPAIQAQDQSGTLRDLASLAGEQGLLLIVNRSADW